MSDLEVPVEVVTVKPKSLRVQEVAYRLKRDSEGKLSLAKYAALAKARECKKEKRIKRLANRIKEVDVKEFTHRIETQSSRGRRGGDGTAGTGAMGQGNGEAPKEGVEGAQRHEKLGPTSHPTAKWQRREETQVNSEAGRRETAEVEAEDGQTFRGSVNRTAQHDEWIKDDDAQYSREWPGVAAQLAEIDERLDRSWKRFQRDWNEAANITVPESEGTGESVRRTKASPTASVQNADSGTKLLRENYFAHEHDHTS
jgi:hypothetical protein